MNPLEDDESLSRRGFLVGAAGAATAAGASATAMAQEDGEGGNGEGGGGNETSGDGGGGDGNETSDGGGGGGGGTETVEVVDNEFKPDSLTIEPGTTVEFAWQSTSADHNVHPTSQPDDANWEGHTDLESGDFSFESTFDVEGDYEYQCDPHAGIGMVGSITVDPEAAAGGGGPVQIVPDAAWTLIIATVAGMLSTLSLVYFFMRYGGASAE